MGELVPTRPWWRKKRWAAAFTLWLAGVYPLGHGPALLLLADRRPYGR